jgi:hypothetical protein
MVRNRNPEWNSEAFGDDVARGARALKKVNVLFKITK